MLEYYFEYHSRIGGTSLHTTPRLALAAARQVHIQGKEVHIQGRGSATDAEVHMDKEVSRRLRSTWIHLSRKRTPEHGFGSPAPPAQFSKQQRTTAAAPPCCMGSKSLLHPIRARAHTHTHTCTRAHTHAHVHTHIQTRAHTRAHTPRAQTSRKVPTRGPTSNCGAWLDHDMG
mmetsp:Transcript_10128/g.21677  ORF Transcript_10128/g.21677 Transcript_10128/m.21677 type:complete len:173 (-) Transcript_10128:1709-2227(-)